MKKYGFFEILNHALALTVVCFLQVAGYVVRAFAVGYGNDYSLVYVALLLVNLFYYRQRHLRHAFGTAVEVGHSLAESALVEDVALCLGKLLGCKRHFHGEYLEELFLAAFVVVAVYYRNAAVPNHV